MSNPLQRLFSAMAQLAGSEVECGEFLPSGRKVRLLYGEMNSPTERQGSVTPEAHKPEVALASADRCQSSVLSRRSEPVTGTR